MIHCLLRHGGVVGHRIVLHDVEGGMVNDLLNDILFQNLPHELGNLQDLPSGIL